MVDLLNDKVHVASRYVKWEGNYDVPSDSDVVINATSIGLGDGEARVPLDANTLEPDMVVADVIFNPPETRLIRDAKQRGCQTLDGLGMLVNQAVIAFKIWTEPGCRPRSDARCLGGIPGTLICNWLPAGVWPRVRAAARTCSMNII